MKVRRKGILCRVRKIVSEKEVEKLVPNKWIWFYWEWEAWIGVGMRRKDFGLVWFFPCGDVRQCWPLCVLFFVVGVNLYY